MQYVTQSQSMSCSYWNCNNMVINRQLTSTDLHTSPDICGIDQYLSSLKLKAMGLRHMHVTIISYAVFMIDTSCSSACAREATAQLRS